MIVGAAHHTLLDFGPNCTPGHSSLDQLRDIRALIRPISMVKLKHYWVSFATVDAVVLAEILE
jgi:hypothetical protein